MANDVTLQIGADTSSLDRSFKSLNSTLVKLGAAVAAAFAGKKLIDAAVQQEKAINSLNQALIRSGEFSQEASQDLQDFASQLQEVTTIGDETTLELLALAKSFGVSNEEAKKLVTTAADASVALGVDARTALEQLGGTLSGTQGRLAKFVPEVKELSQEALKSGQAIDIFSKKFAGAAQGELQTFDGALTQTQNIIGDFAEELGFLITQSPIVIDTIKAVGKGFLAAIDLVKNNSGAIRQTLGNVVSLLIRGFGTVTQTILPPLIELLRLTVRTIGALQDAVYGALKAFLGFTAVKNIINPVYRFLLAIADTLLFIADKAVGGVIKAFKSLGNLVGVETKSIEGSLSTLTDGMKSLREGIEDVASVDAASGLRDIIDSAGKVKNSAIDVVDSTLQSIGDGAKNIDFNKLASDISSGLSGKVSIDPKVQQGQETSTLLDDAKAFGETVIDSIKTNIGKAALAFGKSFSQILSQGAKATSNSRELVQKLELELANTTDLQKRADIEKQITEAQAAQVKAQKDAAMSFTGELGAFIGDTLLPGAGQFVKLFLDLAQDPEAFAAFIEGFVDQLPEIIEAIADAMPVVAEALANNADKIVIAIAVGIGKLLEGLVKAILRVLGIGIKNIAREFRDLIISGGEKFFTTIIDGASNFISKIIEEINGAIQGLTGGGKVGGTLGQIGEGIKSTFGFAEGGIVPQGFPNDTGIARVSSGEMVLNQGQQQNLFNLLDRGGLGGASNQMITVQLVMNESILAEQILEINRDNLRTA